jgi:transcriptional regulator with XRE-family HTH domain
MDFKDRLRQIKLDRGITQLALAAAIGVGRTTVSEYESKKIGKMPSTSVFIRIARHLNISTDYLLGVTENPLPLHSNTIQLPLQTTLKQYDIIKKISDTIFDSEPVDMAYSQIFSKRLIRIRRAANISTRELSKKLMISSAAVSAYENKEQMPSFNMLVDIANCFNVSVDYLLCLSDNPFPIHDKKKAPHILELPENISVGQIRFIQRMATDIVKTYPCE